MAASHRRVDRGTVRFTVDLKETCQSGRRTKASAAQESWRQARSELEPFLKEQPDNYVLIGDLALTNMGLGDKAAALALAERAVAANPIEKFLHVLNLFTTIVMAPVHITLSLLRGVFETPLYEFGV
jgi:predicted Zn-dependent protease